MVFYTKSGIPYTAKPTSRGVLTSMRSQYGAGYRGGPKYQPGYYRPAPQTKIIGTPRASGSLGYSRARTVQTGEALHFLDLLVDEIALATSTAGAGMEVNPASQLCLNAMVQGDAVTQRMGRKITCKKLHIKGLVQIPAADTVTAAVRNDYFVDIWIVLDKQTNGGTATGIDSENVFLSDHNDADMGGATMVRKMNFSDRYKVLKHHRIFLRPQVTFDGTDAMVHEAVAPFEINLKLNDIVTTFQSGDSQGTVSQIVDNSIHFLAVTNNAVNAPTISYRSRLRFAA